MASASTSVAQAESEFVRRRKGKMGQNIVTLICIFVLFANFVSQTAGSSIQKKANNGTDRNHTICRKGNYDHCNETNELEHCKHVCLNDTENLHYCCHLDDNTEKPPNNSALVIVIVLTSALSLIICAFNLKIVFKLIVKARNKVACFNTPLSLNGDYTRFDVGGNIIAESTTESSYCNRAFTISPGPNMSCSQSVVVS